VGGSSEYVEKAVEEPTYYLSNLGVGQGGWQPPIVKTINTSKNCDIASWNQATRRLKYGKFILFLNEY
jgi:hypothetical protein